MSQMHIVLNDLHEQQESLSHLVRSVLDDNFASDNPEVPHHLAALGQHTVLLPHPVNKDTRLEVVCHVVTNSVVFVSYIEHVLTSEVEGLACNQVMQGVIVECGDVSGLPYFVLEALLEFVFEDEAMGAVEEAFYFLLFSTRDKLQIKPIQMRRYDRGEIVVLLPSNVEVSPKILLDEVLLSLIDVDNLLEVTQL